MDLQWQIQMLEDLINENPDARIIDFINLVNELNNIENATATDKHNKPDN